MTPFRKNMLDLISFRGETARQANRVCKILCFDICAKSNLRKPILPSFRPDESDMARPLKKKAAYATEYD